MSTTKRNALRNRALLVIGIFTAFMFAGTLLYAFFAEPLLRVLGEVVPGGVPSKLAAPPKDALGFSLERLQADVLFALYILACTFGLLLSLAAIYRRRVWTLITRFFNAQTHPLTLSLFRIVLFTFAAFLYSRDYYLLFSHLPETFLSPPLGMSWLLNVLPVNPSTVAWTYYLFFFSSLMAALGAYTRFFAPAALLLGLYVLGIPNFFGKIDHYNHLILFMAIMAVSPCADTLSVDAFRRARRDPHWTPRMDRVYALPLRFIWLVMATAYFFPGLYKLATGGFAWIFSDNFRNIIFRNWLSVGEWISPLRLDSSPLLYQSGAAAAVVFELAFAVLIFFPRLRPMVAFVGFSFHGVTNLVMRIPFYSLQIAYLTFVDWHRVFTWLGRRFYPQSARLIFDERTSLGRTLGAVRVLDPFGRVSYLPQTQESAQGEAPYLAPYLEVGEVRETGLNALRGLCARVVLLWPLLPFVLLFERFSAKGISQRGLTPGAASTSPTALRTEHSTSSPSGTSARSRLATIALVGTLLVSANVAFGFVRIKDGWPFALYPVFGGSTGPTTGRIQVTKVSPEGEEVVVDVQPLIERYGYGKLNALLRAGVAPGQEETLAALWSLLERELGDITPADRGRFYDATYYVDPTLWAQNPAKLELLAEFPAESGPAEEVSRE